MVKELVKATGRFSLILLLTFFTEKGKENVNPFQANAMGK